MLVQIAAGEALSDSLVTNGRSSGTARVAENNKDVKSCLMDSTSIVTQGLVAALGDHVVDSDSTTPLRSLGLDSLRTMVLLQSVRNDAIEELAMHEVLSCGTIDDLINLVESKNPASKLTAAQESH